MVALAIFEKALYADGMPQVASAMIDQKELSRAAIRLLRAEVLMSDKSMTQIAQMLGVDRQTIGRRLSRETMPMDAFIGIADAIGSDPIALLAEAAKKEKEKAPAASGAATAAKRTAYV